MKTSLQHDGAGFLVGDPVDMKQSVRLLEAIQSDISAMRRAISGKGASPQAEPKVAIPGGRTSIALVPRTSVPSGPGNTALAEAVNRQMAAMVKAAQPAARPAGRTANIVRGEGGRFASSGSPPGSSGGGSSGHGSNSARRIASSIAEGVSRAEGADPTIKAFKEVAEPLKRGYGAILGNREERKKEGWFRRIWSELNVFRTEQSTFDKAANRSLKALEEKPGSTGGSGGGGLLGALSGLMSNIPGAGLLSRGLSAGGGLLSRAGGLAAGAGKGLLGMAKRIPGVAALFGLANGLAIENDDSLSPEQRKTERAKNLGGTVGAVALGALGTVIGGPIGGMVGAALGEWLGSKGGALLAEPLAEAGEFLKASWGEVKAVALGTWDWIRTGWDDVVSGFRTVYEAVSQKWESFVDAAKAEWDTISNLFGSAYEGLKSLPVIGPAVQAAENAAKRTKEVAGAALSAGKDKAVEIGGKALDATKSVAGAAWEGTKEVAASLVPEGLKNKIAARRAIETGADYKQGNIAGLDDVHTRALVASTAATESAGGKLDVVNSAGYMGRYQAGAGWLADAGLIKGGGAAVQAAMKADGFTNEYKWGQSGGMSKFLKNADNWNGGMSYEKYLANADAQDAAFKTNSDKSYQSLLQKGVITKDMSQDDIAGILKARHIAGEGGAALAAKGLAGPTDANGTTAGKYMADLAAGNLYTKAFSSSPATPEKGVTNQPQSATVATAFAKAPVDAFPSMDSMGLAITAKPPQVASASLPSMPSMPAPPPIPDAPAVQMPLSSGDSGRKLTVNAPKPDAGQDLANRRLAHIVTGGYASLVG